MADPQAPLTSTHWGAYRLKTENQRIVAVEPFEQDPLPSAIGQSIPEAVHHECRVAQPMVRRGWLDKGPGPAGGGRGREPFVAVSWDRALDLVAAELARVRDSHGNAAIFGGCYGWASAGRFHHAQSQVHRFLNCIGGYTAHVNSYSTAAAQVIVPHVLGFDFMKLRWDSTTSWPEMRDHSELVVMFGGINWKNAQVSAGGQTQHCTLDWLGQIRGAGVGFVNVSPLESDAWEGLEADWVPVTPGGDVALMLGIAHVLESEGLADRDFLARCCVGYEAFRAYLLGAGDGQPKSPEWAAPLCGLESATIAGLARRMAGKRCLITVAWSLQRGDHGEQPYWMAATLAAMLGQIGLPGGGVGYGYGAMGGVGDPVRWLDGLSLPQGKNPTGRFIPVARITDLLERPGETYDYNGQRLTYPDTRLVYWCGGNPFHHHQDLNRLRQAWQRPDTVIVNEPWWTATAKHADIVLPATTPYERNDIGRTGSDPFLMAMQQAIPPQGQARSDYAIFSGLAARLGVATEFTEDRDEAGWLAHLYDRFRQQVAEKGLTLPGFEEFWQTGYVELPVTYQTREPKPFAAFRADPVSHPLETPSGRIEIFSQTIAGFGYADCPGHPTWMEPVEWSGSQAAAHHPLHLLSPQPESRLHSQLDCGKTSLESKLQGREVMLIHPQDAAPRAIADGDLVRLFNDRGACLAGARLSRGVRPGVVVLPTGAWFDPGAEDGDGPGLERHGNPNVLTLDKGTSRLAQGSAAHSTLVEVEPFRGAVPPLEAHRPPEIVTDWHDSAGPKV